MPPVLDLSGRPLRLAERILRALDDGCECAREVAEALHISVDLAHAVLSRMHQEGWLDREPKPTYRYRGEGKPSLRYWVRD